MVPMNAPNKPDIVIVGGSLGGLFAVVALKSHGYNTVILERTPTFLLENQGAGIVAGGDTIDFFKRYDRTGKPVAVPSYKRLYLDRMGNVVHEEVNRQNMTSWDLTYYLLRANYDRVDSPYLAGGNLPEERPTDGRLSYRPGCTVNDMCDEGDKVRVKFRQQEEDGSEIEVELTTDFLIAADGPSSTIRKILEPQVERKYAGYCVICGTVPETEASDAALEVFRERLCFFHAPGIQNLTYTIAGENQLEKIMTDKDGRRRRVTIPPGLIAWDAWELLKSRAIDRLPPQMVEMAQKTKEPFVQCITDVISPKNLHMRDKVVLIGDALAGFRPHTVASTSQAAFDVMMLAQWLDGIIDRRTFVQKTMEYARDIQAKGVKIGNRSQFQNLSMEEYVDDRNMMSIPHKDIVFPEWTREDLERI